MSTLTNEETARAIIIAGLSQWDEIIKKFKEEVASSPELDPEDFRSKNELGFTGFMDCVMLLFKPHHDLLTVIISNFFGRSGFLL
ncbi:MAG: hypothetical protein M1338_00440, partial [Patescibacteria group bacterium]|nr:hypothetical protein [Patescibacteria group bacterium]